MSILSLKAMLTKSVLSRQLADIACTDGPLLKANIPASSVVFATTGLG